MGYFCRIYIIIDKENSPQSKSLQAILWYFYRVLCLVFSAQNTFIISLSCRQRKVLITTKTQTGSSCIFLSRLYQHFPATSILASFSFYTHTFLEFSNTFLYCCSGFTTLFYQYINSSFGIFSN